MSWGACVHVCMCVCALCKCTCVCMCSNHSSVFSVAHGADLNSLWRAVSQVQGRPYL